MTERLGGNAGHLLPRRRLLGAAAAGMGLALPWSPRPAAAAVPASIAFEIRRKGSAIGTHRVDFSPAEGGFVAAVTIDLAVKIAFVTVFSYSQRGRDRWRDGVLVSTEVKTVDDGRSSEVVITEKAGSLQVRGAEGILAAPLGTMTDLCFWNAGIVGQRQVVDAQTGELADLTSVEVGREQLAIAGRQLATTHYRMSSSKGRTGEIWYDGSGRWVQATITTRGETLDYRLL